MADPTPPGAYLFYLRYYASIDAHLRADGGRALAAHMDSVLTSNRVLGKLEKTTPSEQIYFGEEGGHPEDRAAVWAMTGQDPKSFAATVKVCPAIGVSEKTGQQWVLGRNPFSWLMALVVKWYSENGDEQQTRRAVMLLTVHFYASLTYKFYERKGGAQENAMAYAVNALSDKFILKREGSVFGTLMAMAWASHTKYLPNLRDASDALLFKYFINLRNRINGMMVSVFKVYLGVLSRGAYLNQARERYDTGEMAERTTNSGRVQATTDKLSEAFVGEAASDSALTLASRMADVPRVSLLAAVNGMRANEGARVREIFQLLAEVFLEEKGGAPEDIRTRGFFAFAVALYARSNTKDGRIERIKAELDALLAAHSEFYTRTNREATRGAFRKSLFIYIVAFMMQRV